MIHRFSHFIRPLADFLRTENPDWAAGAPFEEPPAGPDTVCYDLALPCFALAKVRRQSPQACAEDLCQKIDRVKGDLGIEKAVVIKGFLNIRFLGLTLGSELKLRQVEVLGDARQALKTEKYVVDFSSPNIAKPFGIGHLRSTNIGAAICRMASAMGAQVVKINHLGDWGTQFGKIITAYKRFGSAQFVKGDPVQNLYRLYVEFHQKEKDDPALMDEARDWFVKLESGDPEATELWKWFKDVSFHEFKKIYDRLDVSFDYVTGESFYNNLMEYTVQAIQAKGLLKESEGAQVVDLEPYGMPPCLIRKSDGSTLYATRDLSTAEYRYKTFQPTTLVYVVGSEQILHFRQVFKVLELMGYDWAKNCSHVPFGLIKFPDGKMSTRKGNIILLEEVLDQSIAEAYKIVHEKNAEKAKERQLTEEEMLDISRKVGTGAVIFFDLKAKRMKDVLFDWKELLNFEGDSGPYLQYTFVRLNSLLERAASEGISLLSSSALELVTEEERLLARQLLRFPAALEIGIRSFEPSILSHELLELAAVFNRFYMNVPLLKGDEKYRAGRLGLVQQTRDTIRFGLALLGIECPQKM